MTEKQLKEAKFLESDIWQTKRDLEDIKSILNDYDNFGSTIEFKRNKDGYSRSFGSKKNNFKPKLKELLLELRTDLSLNLNSLKKRLAEI